MTIKRKNLFIGIIAVLLVLVVGFVCVSAKAPEVIQQQVRTIELNTETDYASILNEFENSELKTDGSLTTFVGYQTLSADLFAEFDNVSENDIEQVSGSTVQYKMSYDKDSNIVTIQAELINEIGEIQIDTISGVAFINESGNIDAVMNLDGEGVLLSEMQQMGLIANCGWFSNLFKKIVKAVVTAVVVAAVVVATAAVVVATAGAAAPALVAAGVGVATSTAVTATSAAVGVAAGALFAATIGTAALQAGTAFSEIIAEGAKQIVDKATGAILSIIIKGAEYALVAVTSGLIYNIAKNSYFLTAIANDGVVYMSTTPLDRTLATWAVRSEISVYTFYSSNAYQVAKDAGDGLLPVWDAAHRHDSRTGALKKGIFFDHWHKYKHQGSSHCMYGTPYINL